MNNKIAAIILTKNESMHLKRCILSVSEVCSSIYVVDCGSDDDTVAIAQNNGAIVLKNEWVNYSTQFNWAIDHVSEDNNWLLRIDADEYILPELSASIRSSIDSLDDSVCGVYFNRRMTFQGKVIKYGGIFPVSVLRLFRNGSGFCEKRWMDEHIIVKGNTVSLPGEIIDDNLNNLTWWINKHNMYANREAVDLLNHVHRFEDFETISEFSPMVQSGMKRWIKENIYANLPIALRALIYFLYRYIVRLGFLDGQAGSSFHVLQGFWYRYLVDCKINEVNRYVNETGADIIEAIDVVLGIKVGS